MCASHSSPSTAATSNVTTNISSTNSASSANGMNNQKESTPHGNTNVTPSTPPTSTTAKTSTTSTSTNSIKSNTSSSLSSNVKSRNSSAIHHVIASQTKIGDSIQQGEIQEDTKKDEFDEREKVRPISSNNLAEYSNIICLSADLSNLLNNELLSDITFLIGPDRMAIHAHKVILVQRSVYFRSMFLNGMQESYSKTIERPDFDPVVFNKVLQYIYTGKVQLSNENALHVLATADELQITELKQFCVMHVKDNIDIPSALTMLDLAYKYCSEELILSCYEFIKHNTAEVLHSRSFLLICKDTLMRFLESEYLAIDEINIYLAVIRWGLRAVQIEKENIARDAKEASKGEAPTPDRISDDHPSITHLHRPNENIYNYNNYLHYYNVNTSNLEEEVQESYIIEDNSNVHDVSPLPLSTSSTTAATTITSNNSNNIDTHNTSSVTATTISPTTSSNINHPNHQNGSLHVDSVTNNPQEASQRKKSSIHSFVGSILKDKKTKKSTETIIRDEKVNDATDNNYLMNLSPHLEQKGKNVQKIRKESYISVEYALEKLMELKIDCNLKDFSSIGIRSITQKLREEDKRLLREAIRDLVPFVRFPLMTSQQLIDIVEPFENVPDWLLLEAYRHLAAPDRFLNVKRAKKRKGHSEQLSQEFELSTILTSQHKSVLIGWCESFSSKKKKKWTIRYKASRDGFDSKKFHELCDSQGPTITVCRTTDGYVFGGFNSTSWSSNNCWVAAQDTFIFSLINPFNDGPRKLKVKNPQRAVYNSSMFGPTFGGGANLYFDPYDIYIDATMTKGHTNVGNAYSTFRGGWRSDEAQRSLAGSLNSWTLNEVEVFSLV